MGFFKKLFQKKSDGDGNDKWNAMWELWEAGEIPSPYNELLTYDSDLQNGGHLQFFLNRALRRENIFAVMAALRETLPAGHADNAAQTYRQYCMLGIDTDNDGEIMQALDDDPLCVFDEWYFDHEEELLDVLEAYANSL